MTPDGLQRENEELRRRLTEAEEALSAIRSGQVDAIVMESAAGAQVFSLSGVETVYRLAVETMAEAFINTTAEGTILFSNGRFAEFVATPMEHVLGRELGDFVPAEDRESMRALLEECARRPVQQRVVFQGAGGVLVPAMLSGRAQIQDGGVTLCLVAADRTETERQLDSLERVNRLYAVLSHVNEAILRVWDQQALFETACRIAVEDGGFVLAWIGFVDAARRVRVAAKHGFDEGYLDNLNLSIDPDMPEGQGPTAIALRECKLVINNDTANNPIMAPWREQQLKRGFAASASFPLVVDGNCIGAMTLYADKPGTFDEEEVRLLTALANDLSFALQSEADRMSGRTTTRELETTRLLLEAANDLNSWTDLDSLLHRLADVALRVTRHSRVHVASLSDDRSSVTFRASRGEVVFPVGTVLAFEGLPDSLQEALIRGRTKLAEFPRPHENKGGLAEGYDGQRLLIVPITFEERVLGYIAVDDPGEGIEFTDREIAILEGIASQAAVAIENARLFEAEQAAQRQTRRELETTAILLRASTTLATSIDLDTVLDVLVDAAVRFGGRSRIVVALYDEDRSAVRIVRSCGVTFFPVGTEFRLEDVPSYIAAALKERRTVVFDIETADADWDRDSAERPEQVVSSCVPLAVGERVLGFLALGEPGVPAPMTEREQEIVEGIAAQASLAIENSLRFQERAVRSELAQALNRINARVHSSLDFEEIVNGVVVEVRDALQTDSAAVQLHRDGYWEFAHSVGLTAAVRDSRPGDEETPLFMSMLDTRQPVVVNDVDRDERGNSEILRRFRIKSLLGAPIVVRDQAIGLLVVNRIKQPAPFTLEQVDFLRKAAATLGLALENARLYQAEHDIADQLQSALLALPDEVEGIEFAHSYHSATEAARVGGDFYDVFEFNHDHVGILIGDVAGKGIDAAMLTSLVKNTIRAHAHERGKTPKRILELTNEVVYKATTTEAFVTVFFGILNRRSGRLVYANAGHTTAASVRADGTVGALAATGPLLGALEGVEYGEAETRLELDDLLFLYTDGLTEARRDGELYGEERLFDFLSSTQVGPVQDVVQNVIQDVMVFSGDRLRDDLAVLAVKRVEPGAETLQQQRTLET